MSTFPVADVDIAMIVGLDSSADAALDLDASAAAGVVLPIDAVRVDAGT